MANENVFLFHALCMGAFITSIYDILRVFRRVIPHGRMAISLEDIIFWLYSAIKVFLLMHRESNGTLRWFAVLGALTGMLLYKKTVSSFLVTWVSFVLRRVVLFVWSPFRAVGKVTDRALTTARKKFLRGGRYIKQRMKKKLTFFLKVLKMNL